MIAFLRSAPSPLFSRRGLDLDFPMLAGCLALLGLGLVMITSASSEVAAVNADNPMYYMIRHLIYVLLGIGAAALVLLVPLSVWQRLDWMLLIAAFVLLILVLIPGIGREVNGSMRWIGFGAFNVQPSELAKLFVVVYLAGYLVRRQQEVRESLWGFLKPFLVLLPMAMLLLLEPDFGKAAKRLAHQIAGGSDVPRLLEAGLQNLRGLFDITPVEVKLSQELPGEDFHPGRLIQRLVLAGYPGH